MENKQFTGYGGFEFGLQLQKHVDEKFGKFIKAEPYYRESFTNERLILNDNQVLFIQQAKFVVPDDSTTNKFSVDIWTDFVNKFTFVSPVIMNDRFNNTGEVTNIFLRVAENLLPSIQFTSIIGYIVTFEQRKIELLKVIHDDELNIITLYFNGYVKAVNDPNLFFIYKRVIDGQLTVVSAQTVYNLNNQNENQISISAGGLVSDDYVLSCDYGFFSGNTQISSVFNENDKSPKIDDFEVTVIS